MEKMKPAEEKKMLSLVVKMFQFTPIVESHKLLLTVFLENDRMFVQSPLTLKMIAIFFLCAAALQTHPAVFSTECSLWPDSSLPSVCDDRLISTRTITRPLPSLAHLLEIAREIPASLEWRWPCPRIRQRAARGKLEIAIVGLGRLWSLQPRGLTVN